MENLNARYDVRRPVAPGRPAKPAKSHVSRVIQQARLARQWTQRDLAIRSGLREAHIGMLENDRRRFPRLETLKRVADALEIDPGEFFKG